MALFALENALIAACIASALLVVWWSLQILAA
jgi:hypothetical protein